MNSVITIQGDFWKIGRALPLRPRTAAGPAYWKTRRLSRCSAPI